MASAAVFNPTRDRRRTNMPAQRSDDLSKGIWSSMLDSVATGKKLAEKNLVVLGGTPDTQKDFLEALSQESSRTRRSFDRSYVKKPPLANRFALGYTYQDILDADQDDILARLSSYLLSDYDPAFSSLLQPLFTPATIPNTLIVVLLDWESPWTWARQLRDWIKLLRAALSRLDNDCKNAMDENMKEWTERRKGSSAEAIGAASDAEVAMPLGTGAWDEALGIPICVVCQNVEKAETLEREHAWKDDEFDFVQQYLRTVLLKHGGGLIYTASAAPGSLQNLIRSSLDVRSLLQRNPLKHNVIDRDKILVPPNWDSWGKIRPLGEAFDIEKVSDAWSVDLNAQHSRSTSIPRTSADPPSGDMEDTTNTTDEIEDNAVSIYEAKIEDPNRHRNTALQLGANQTAGIDKPCQDTQTFLASQLQVLEQLRVDDEREQKTKESRRPAGQSLMASRGGQSQSSGNKVNDHIGPVQFNMGGIQVDADDMLKSLKEREGGRSSEDTSLVASPDGKLEHEKLSSFFAGLVSRGSNSAANSPK